jgi:ABC-type transport system involved in multi-copper enzyme maturation permease subunit
MILQEARLTIRLQRFELLAFGAALVGLAAAGFVAAIYVDAIRPSPACFEDSTVGGCSAAMRAWNDAQQTLGGLLFAPMLFVATLAGVFFGVPIVGREIERGTTRLAWSLAPSRGRWFAARAFPTLVILVLLTFAVGVAVDRFFAASVQGEDPAASFTLYGARGVLLASRAACIFGIAVLVGAVVGRALPAIILTGLVAAIVLGGGEAVHQNIVLRNEAVPVPVDFTDESDSGTGPGDLYMDTAFELPDGSLVGWQYFADEDPYDSEGNPRYPMFSMVIPGDRYRFVEVREAVVLAGGTLVALLLAGAVVSRRRPG